MTRTRSLLLTFALVVTVMAVTSWAQTGPSVDQLISLKRVGSPAISPDGRFVAYTVREPNWDENSYETEIWLAETATGAVRQLTNAKKSSGSPAWSPDSTRIAFTSDRSDKDQIYVIRVAGGEAEPVTSADDGVAGTFAWSPDGASIAYTVTDPKPGEWKDRDKKYGEFEITDADVRQTHLWVIDLASKKPRHLTKGDFSVGSFDWSPDGRSIAFDHRVNGTPGASGTADISAVSVADGAIRAVVTLGGPDTHPLWSPDGKEIAFESAMGSATYYSYENRHVAIVSALGGTARNVSKTFDETSSLVAWTKGGLFFSASARAFAHLYRLDPASGTVTQFTPDMPRVFSGASLSADGAAIAFVRSGPGEFPDVWVVSAATGRMSKLTNMGAQTAAWPRPTQEVITWKSKDGTEIEGVLHKPAHFKAGVRYPLLVVIHGGPTGVSRPVPFSSTSTYPIDIWLNKGALVLEPNYRGSAGYGEKFRSLNIRNLGIGDAWDVISGIDALVAQGLVDNDRVGTMGWSQGGYISAFLTTHDSARFRAVSVGAGISNWVTYYVNTDIHPFTRMYLKATPWDDPKIYADTSPMTYVKQAKAPTLIQHGELDRRVPIPNAYELYQGLQDQGVPAKLIVYKGFGHGLTKPKAHRAAMDHNLEWFGKYIWGEMPPAAPKAGTMAGVTNYVRVSDTIACAGAIKPESAAEIRKAGFAAVINLRVAGEENYDADAEQKSLAAAGLKYVTVPFRRTDANAKDGVRQAVAALADPANSPAFLHCASGGRASVVLMAKRVLVDGWAIDRALVEAKVSAGMTPQIEQWALDVIKALQAEKR
jgi:uncharacterized protein (TIGR01244 family)